MWWFENLIEKSNFVRVPWKYALTKQTIKFQSSGEGEKKNEKQNQTTLQKKEKLEIIPSKCRPAVEVNKSHGVKNEQSTLSARP